MADSIVKVSIVADTKGLKTGMGDAEKSTVSLGDKFKLLGKAAVAYLAFQAVRAVKNFVGDSRRAFIDLNESVNAVDRIFGDLAPQIHAIGKTSADSMGLSRAAFNSAAVAMSGFARNIAGDGGDVVGTLDTLMRRAVDFASVVNIEVSEALEIFQSTLAGQSRPIRRYGIDISDTAIKNHALAEGIVSSSKEMTEQQKQAARASLLLQETNRFAGDFADTQDELANATRRADAQLENAKANFGEALQSVWQAAIPVMNATAKAVGVLAIGFSQLTGQMSPAEAGIRNFEIHMNQAADTAQAALTINKEYGVGFSELLAKMSLTTDELKILGGQTDAYYQSIGLTSDGVLELKTAVDDKLRVAIRNAMKPTVELTGDYTDLGDEADEAAGKLDETTSALQRWEDEVRSQFDPLHRLRSAQASVADAQQRVTDVYKDGKSTEKEKLDALFDLEQKNRDLTAAQIAAGEQSTITASQYRASLEKMGGFTKAQIDAMVADFNRVNAFKFDLKTLTIKGQIVGVPKSLGGGGIMEGFQHGGRPKKGEPAIVGEAGPEIFVPDTAGTIIPNGKSKGTPVGLNGHAPVVNVYVTVQGSITTERELAQTLAAGVRDELLRMQRRNGSVFN